MSFPKWKYRIHPTLGFYQSTQVITPEGEAELDADWSDTKPEKYNEGTEPNTPVTETNGMTPLTAEIHTTLTGDISHG